VPDPRQDTGRRGEELAEQMLRRRGMKTVARRYRTPYGEIDLIMRDGRTVVFVEVKTQSSDRLGSPHERVSTGQRRRMERAARTFLHMRRWTDRPCRFDVVSVVLPPGGPPHVQHFPDAFVPRRD